MLSFTRVANVLGLWLTGHIILLAVVFAVIVIIKMAVMLILPKWISGFAGKVFNQSRMILNGISVIFIVIVGYFVLLRIDILTVLAVMLFTHILIGMFFLQYPKEIMSLSKKMMKDKSKMLLVALLYVALAVWGLVVVFT